MERIVILAVAWLLAMVVPAFSEGYKVPTTSAELAEWADNEYIPSNVAAEIYEWTKKPVDELAKLSDGKDLLTQDRAMRALASIGGDKARAVLRNKLNDQEPVVRQIAIRGLGNAGNIKDIPALVQRLRAEVTLEKELERTGKLVNRCNFDITNPQMNTQGMIVKAIGKILRNGDVAKAEQGRNELAILMSNGGEDKRVRLMIARALARVGDKRALPVLEEGLSSDPNGQIRAFCAIDLGILGDTAAIPALKAALNDPYEAPTGGRLVNEFAQKALSVFPSFNK